MNLWHDSAVHIAPLHGGIYPHGLTQCQAHSPGQSTLDFGELHRATELGVGRYLVPRQLRLQIAR